MNQEVKNINGYDIKDIKAIRTYDTVALMKADRKLKQGQHVKTRGYYSIHDGGSAEYYIVNEVSENNYKENLENGLYAILIIDNYVTPEQFGAYGDGIHDDTTAIQNAFDSNNVIMKKSYLISDSLTLPSNIVVDGYKTCEITNNTDNYTFIFNGSSRVELKNIKRINCNYGVIFTGNRSWYTDINNVEIRAVNNAFKIESPTGYNNFTKCQVYVSNDNGLAIEIGKTDYSESIQPNYLFFNNCYFTIDTAFTSNTATCLKLINGQYINFSKCDFVSYNKVFNISCSLGSRCLNIIDCDIFAVYNLFYIDNTEGLYGLNFINNRITRQTSEITYINCDNNTAYINDFIFKDNIAINGGGSEAATPFIINYLYKPIIKDNVNISYNSTVTNCNSTSGYEHGTQIIDLENPTTTPLNITKNGPFPLEQPVFTLVPDSSNDSLTYNNMYKSSVDGKWYLGNLQGKGKIVW